ncbi:MAG: PCYCGC motif-containing (lipo)protein [Gemmatimonadales bacterium]
MKRPSDPQSGEAHKSRGRRRLVVMLAGAAFIAGLAAWLLLTVVAEPEMSRAVRQEYAPVTSVLVFPEQVRLARPELRELYEFAARRPDVLHYVPCFCGCASAGHRSAYDCFIDSVHADGTVEIDEMGFT